MKKLLCAVPALLLFAMIGASNARADSYTPTFSCTPENSSDFGCFWISNGYTAPDVTFPSPTLQVTVDNEVFNVTLPAGDSPTDSYGYSFKTSNLAGTPPFFTDAYGILTIGDGTTGTTDTATDLLGHVLLGDLVGVGTLTFSPVSSAAPEPTPILLMLLGAGLIFFMRKRFVTPTPRTA